MFSECLYFITLTDGETRHNCDALFVLLIIYDFNRFLNDTMPLMPTNDGNKISKIREETVTH